MEKGRNDQNVAKGRDLLNWATVILHLDDVIKLCLHTLVPTGS